MRILQSNRCRVVSSVRTPQQPRAAGKLGRQVPKLRRAVQQAAAPTDVFVFDLDGTLVDSAPEIVHSSIRAAAKIWPDVLSDADTDVQKLGSDLHQLRPLITEGYELVVAARLLKDRKSADELQRSWPQCIADGLSEHGAQESDVAQSFADVRQNLMQDDPQAFVSRCQPYGGVATALQCFEHPFYIATSDYAARTSKVATAALELKGFEQEDSPRMFCALIPPNEKKAEALTSIMERPMCQEQSTTLHYVDDRADTLLYLAQQPHLQRWRLYFADWGYSTQEDKERVASNAPLVRTLSLKAFEELLKWGVVMGVDDGCEPEDEEKQAAMARQVSRGG